MRRSRHPLPAAAWRRRARAGAVDALLLVGPVLGAADGLRQLLGWRLTEPPPPTPEEMEALAEQGWRAIRRDQEARLESYGRDRIGVLVRRDGRPVPFGRALQQLPGWLVVGAGYALLLRGGGQTPGMRLVGIRLVRLDGRPLDRATVLVAALAPGVVNAALVRLARPLGRGRAVALTWLVRSLPVLLDRDRRGIGDRLAGTRVVERGGR